MGMPETKQLPTGKNSTPEMRKALSEVAMFRRAKVSRDEIDAFANALAENYSEQEVTEACRSIRSLPRVEGELSFPELAVFEHCCKAARAIRTANEQRMRGKLVARWVCPKCGTCYSGYIFPDDYKPRICRSTYAGKVQKRGEKRSLLPDGEVCGEILNQTARLQEGGDGILRSVA